MQLSHTSAAVSASFDDPNLVSAAGLLPALRLAEQAGLGALADQWLSVPSDKGANAGRKVLSLVAGMLAGADSIDDMGLLRHGGMRKLFRFIYAPSTLGSFLRTFTFGHVRQLDAVASRFLRNLSALAPLLAPAADDPYVFLDIDDTIVEVHGHQKQGAGFGYSRVRGLNVLLATAKTATGAPVVIGQRLRRGPAGSNSGSPTMVREAVAALRRLSDRPVLARFDSAFYGRPTVAAVLGAGADVSVTVRMNPSIVRALGAVPENVWTKIRYSDAVYDEDAQEWISEAEVAETPYTAFTSHHSEGPIAGRLVVRRVPARRPRPGQPALFQVHRFHAFFTTSTLDTVTADRVHRGHASIEQVNADLKNSALAHLPSGVFTANAAWLVLAVIAFNLTRTIGVIAGGAHTRATTGTLRRTLITVPARVASSARRIQLHLPENWPWQQHWRALFDHEHSPPRTVSP